MSFFKSRPDVPVLRADDEGLVTALGALVIARGAILDPGTLQIYLTHLSTEHQPSVIAACVTLAREPKGQYEAALPDVGRILKQAKVERWNSTKPPARVAGYLPPAPGEPTYRCGKCFDDPAGFIRAQQCPIVKCDRKQDHAPHYFTVRCPCWLQRNEGALMMTKDDYERKGKRLPPDVVAVIDLLGGHYRWNKPMDLWGEA